MSDPINPDYYKSANGIEAIDALEAMLCDSPNDSFTDYCRAQILHYLWRLGRKNENPLQDIKKAQWYINRLVGYLESEEREARGIKQLLKDIYADDKPRAELDERNPDNDGPKPIAPEKPAARPERCKRAAPPDDRSAVNENAICNCGG